MDKWTSVFGAPKNILTDNGREFQNESVEEMYELFDKKLLAAAAESHGAMKM